MVSSRPAPSLHLVLYRLLHICTSNVNLAVLGPAILILEKGRRMARELLCVDAGRSIQTHHTVPVFAAHPGAAAGKELDRGGRA